MEPIRLVVRATARLYQRIIALIILSGAFVGLSFFLIYFLINSSYLFPLFDGVVNPQLRGRIGFERITWGPAPWRVKVLRPVVWGPDGRKIARLQSLLIDEIHLRGLLAGHLDISGLTMQSGHLKMTARPSLERLDLAGRPDLLFDLEEALWPPGPRYDDGEKAGITLDVEGVDINDFTVHLDMPEASMVNEGVFVADAHFEARPDANRLRMGAARVTASASELRVRREDDGPPPLHGGPATYYGWAIGNLELKNYIWRDDTFSVVKLAAKVNGDPLRVDHFRMDLTEPGTPSMAGKVHLEIAEIARQLAPFGVDEIRGPVTVDLSGRGPADAFAGVFSLDGQRLTVYGQPIDRLRVHGTKGVEGRIHVDRLEITALNGLVDGQLDYDVNRADLAAELWLDGVDITRVEAPLPPVVGTLAAGRWAGVARVRGRGLMGAGPRFATDGRLRSSRTQRRGMGLGRSVALDWAAALSDNTLAVNQLVFASDDLKVSGAGTLALDGQKSNLAGRIQAAELGLIAADFGLDLAGGVDARWTLDGPLTSPRVRASLEGQQLRFAEFPAADVTGQLLFADQRLSFDPKGGEKGTQIAFGEGQASVRGSVDLSSPGSPLKLRISARKIDLASLPLGVDVAGRVDADVTLSGPTTQLSVAAKGRVSRPCVRVPNGEQVCFRRIDADGRWKNGALVLDRFRLADDDRTLLDAVGTVDVAGERFNGQLRLFEIPLALVSRAIRPAGGEALPLRGAVTLDLGGEGDFKRPHGRGRIEMSGLGYGPYELGDGTFEIDAGGEVIALSGRQIFEKFTVDAAVPTHNHGPPATVRVAFDDLSLEERVPQLQSLPITVLLGGQVEATLDPYRGELDQIRVQLHRVHATYTVPTGARSTAVGSEQSFVVSNVRDVQLSLRHDVVNVDQFLLSVGRADGAAIISSPSAAVMPVASLGLANAAGISSGVVNATTGLAQAAIELSAAPMNETRIKLMGTVGVDQSLDLRALGNIDLDLVQPFLRSVFTEMSGFSRFDLQVGGTVDDPLPKGTLWLDRLQGVPRSGVVGGQVELRNPAAFELMPRMGPFFRRDGSGLMRGVMDLRLANTDSRGEFTQGPPTPLRILRDESELTVTDLSVEFEEFLPQWVQLKANFFEQYVNMPRVLRATVSGKDIGFEMSHQREDGSYLEEPTFMLSGDLRILHGKYIADIKTTSGVTESVIGKTQQQTVDAFEQNPALRRLKLDVSVFGDGDFEIRNHISELALNLDIRIALDRIRGNLAPQPETGDQDAIPWEPLDITGRVTVLPDSTLTYANREFEVTRGVVDFTDVNFVDAELVATKTFRLRTGTATSSATSLAGGSGDVQFEEVKLTATYRQLTPYTKPAFKLGLASNSGSTELEVATLVLTGSRPSDITGAAGAGGAAAGFLLAPLMNLVERPLEDTFDLELDVTPSSTGQLFIDSELVLSQRLTLYTKVLVGEAGEGQSQTVGVDYQLNNFTLFQFVNTQTDADVATTTLRLRTSWELD